MTEIISKQKAKEFFDKFMENYQEDAHQLFLMKHKHVNDIGNLIDFFAIKKGEVRKDMLCIAIRILENLYEEDKFKGELKEKVESLLSFFETGKS